MNIPSECVVDRAPFRLLLNREQDRKIQRLKESLTDLGEVDKCELQLEFFHGFNTKAYRIGSELRIPSNILGVAKLFIHTMDGNYIPFHVVCTFSDLISFMTAVDPYMSNSKYVKTFQLDETDSPKRFIILDTKLTD